MDVPMNRPLSREAHSRSLAKAVMFAATVDTFIISLIVTGRVVIAGTIAATEITAKYSGQCPFWVITGH